MPLPRSRYTCLHCLKVGIVKVFASSSVNIIDASLELTNYAVSKRLRLMGTPCNYSVKLGKQIKCELNSSLRAENSAGQRVEMWLCDVSLQMTKHPNQFW